MRKSIKLYAMILALPVIAMLSSCEPKALTEQDVYVSEDQLAKILDEANPEGYDFYTLNGFLDAFMTEEGNFNSDSSLYRTRSEATGTEGKLYMFTIDTLPVGGRGIYIRGRVTTDDFGGNFYKSLVIQQVVEGDQQNLRISVDLGSAAGMFPLGQEIMVRCNGLAIGRYANQPQLCVPSYNNNVYAMNANEKVGWAPGRIPSGRWRSAATLVGAPDTTKLMYDSLTLDELYNKIPGIKSFVASNDRMKQIRYADGRLIVLKDVYFTGQYDDNGTLKDCDTQHPDSAGSANVFAPTTNNIGYPQSRVISTGAGTRKLFAQCSEYAKFAYFYLPGADNTGVADCKNWVGTITGILGFYEDKGSDISSISNTNAWKEWSVTPRGIRGIGLPDVRMFKDGVAWQPKEYNPNAE